MNRLFRLAYGLIGIVCMCISVGTAINVRRFFASSDSAPGTVVELVRATDSKSRAKSVPKVRYTAHGATYEIKGTVSTSPSAYHIGQTVRVVYNTAAPEKGRLDVWWEQYFVSMVLGVIGAVFTGMGFCGAGMCRRR